ncbi:MAG: [Clostridia bacterium]|nr:[FeFe] hydrogenase H-cluster maturation GTPase HydF [Clostridia bacterium]
MSMNETPRGERLHIGFFGRRNAGKSSLVNAFTNQNLSVVSDVAGTTTDPVLKAMELLPLGPVTIIDTPGFDDEGDLGALRVEKTREILAKTDIAVLVADATLGILNVEETLISLFKEKNIPYIIVMNKIDLAPEAVYENAVKVSAKDKTNLETLREAIANLNPQTEEKRIVSDLLKKGSVAVLVTPIDKAAPKGRLILPQQQTIRDLLDNGNVVVVCKETELEQILDTLKQKPDIVICDSQVFELVAKIVPDDVLLTSFSILFARYKGFLEEAVKGVATIKNLRNNSKILISEGCSHHRQCGDIGTQKIPEWIRRYKNKEFDIEFSSGGTFPQDLKCYDLIIHCGGCMLNEREMKSRVERAKEQGIPITNYGILIAFLNGILKRSIKIFPDLYKLL